MSVHIDKKKRHRTHEGAYARLTEEAHGRPRITEDPPIRTTVDDDEQLELVDELLAGYRETLQEDRRHLFDRFTEADVVRQVVGVGSVGMRVYLVLLEGRSGSDPLFLQCKQAGPSVYEAHTRPSVHTNHGARVVAGKRLVQSATDIFVGWSTFRGHDYYVRQFRDMKIIPTIELIAPRLAEFATACGESLARAHAKTGDPVAIDAYLGNGHGIHRGHGGLRRSLRRPERPRPRPAGRRHRHRGLVRSDRPGGGRSGDQSAGGRRCYGGPMTPPILLCADGSDLSLDALAAGLDLLGREHHYLLVTVADAPDPDVLSGTGHAGAEMSDRGVRPRRGLGPRDSPPGADRGRGPTRHRRRRGAGAWAASRAPPSASWPPRSGPGPSCSAPGGGAGSPGPCSARCPTTWCAPHRAPWS